MTDVGIRFRRNEQRKIDCLVSSFLGCVSIRGENEPVSVVKLEGNDNKNVRQSRNKYKEKSERTYFSVRSDYVDKMKKVIENYLVDNTCDNRDCFDGLFGATINAFGSM